MKFHFQNNIILSVSNGKYPDLYSFLSDAETFINVLFIISKSRFRYKKKHDFCRKPASRNYAPHVKPETTKKKTPYPDGLVPLLHEFTQAVLKFRPKNLYDFAAEYFETKRQAIQRREPSIKLDKEARNEKYIASGDNDEDYRVYDVTESAENVEKEQDADDPLKDKRPIYTKSEEVRRQILESFFELDIFNVLTGIQLRRVIDSVFEVRVHQNDVVIRQNDLGDYFYVIKSGLYEVTVDKYGRKTERINVLDSKGFFGELALMYNQPRSATVTAVTSGDLWAMERTAFCRFLGPAVYEKRKSYETFLANIPILQTLSHYQRLNLSDALTSTWFDPGELVISKGDVGHGMYFIEEGRVRIEVLDSQDREARKRSVMKRNDYFGEIALIEGGPRAANVYAIDYVRLAFLPYAGFHKYLTSCIEPMLQIISSYRGE